VRHAPLRMILSIGNSFGSAELNPKGSACLSLARLL
jgi:hypothetical protein